MIIGGFGRCADNDSFCNLTLINTSLVGGFVGSFLLFEFLTCVGTCRLYTHLFVTWFIL